MDEFIKKLIERLEGKAKRDEQRAIKADETERISVITALQALADRYYDAIEIVKEHAGEYNNGYCESQSEYKFISDKYKRETGCGYTYYDLHHAEPFKFCPYCGKEIKVLSAEQPDSTTEAWKQQTMSRFERVE